MSLLLLASPVSNGLLTASTPPGVLDADPEAARWTPVHLEFTVPANRNVTILAQIGADSALWMAAYDELIPSATGKGALAPLFADKSSVMVNGSFGTGRTFVMDVLPNGGWQRPDVKIVPYVTQEVT